MKKLNSLAFILLIVISGCNLKKSGENIPATPPAQLNDEISISGADALMPLIKIWADEFSKIHENLIISVAGGGTGTGIEQLQFGNIDLAMVSRKLTADEEIAGLFSFPVSKEGVVPIVSENNPFVNMILEQGIKRHVLKRLYSEGDIYTWGNILDTSDDDQVILYNRSDISGASDVWANYLGLQKENLLGIGVEGDINMVKSIMGQPFAIGYCNAHYAYDYKSDDLLEGLVVIPLDLNNNGTIEPHEKFYDRLHMVQRAAYLGKYPNLLCREIMLVSKGIPQNQAIVEFLKWIYLDGQRIAEKNGYSRIRQCVIDDYLEILQ